MNKLVIKDVNKDVKKAFTSEDIKKLTFTSILLAGAIVVNFFDLTVPIAGAPVMAIRFGNVLLRLIAILFGGVYGGIAGALQDVISHMIRPNGAFLWQLTVVEFLKGFTIGFLWFRIKKIDMKIFNTAYISVFCFFTIIGIFLLYNFNFRYESFYYMEVLQKITDDILFLSIGLIVAGVLGLAMLVPAYFVSRNKSNDLSNTLITNSSNYEHFLKLIIATGVPCLIFSTVNTLMFQRLFQFTSKTFLVYWTPRIIKEIIQVLVNTYILVILLKIYDKNFSKNR